MSFLPPTLIKLLVIQSNNPENFSKYYRKADRIVRMAWSYDHDRVFFDEISNDELKLLALLLLGEKDALAHFMHPSRFPKNIRRLAAQYIDILDQNLDSGSEQRISLAMLDFVEHGCLDGFKQMIAYGANIHFLSDAALLHAIEQKHTHIVKYILENCADFESHDWSRGWILIQAAKSNLKILKLVLKKFGTMEDLAAHSDNPEIIDYLRSSKRSRTGDHDGGQN